jgi:hypothetical protein
MLNPAEQFAHLGNMSNQVMNAWGDENDSRVAQMRELRRQQHEKDLMAMRTQELLARLQSERFLAAKQMQMQQRAADKASGTLYSSEWDKPLKMGVDY